MVPYGWKKWLWKDEDYGPTSKYTGGRLRSRKAYRRILHAAGRRQGYNEIREQIRDADGNSVRR